MKSNCMRTPKKQQPTTVKLRFFSFTWQPLSCSFLSKKPVDSVLVYTV